MDNVRTRNMIFAKIAEYVAAHEVVDEEEIDVVAVDGNVAKGRGIEAFLFVVAGDDEGQARHGRAL